MLKLTVEIEARTESELEMALERVAEMVGQGYTSTAGYPGLSFEITGEEEPEDKG